VYERLRKPPAADAPAAEAALPSSSASSSAVPFAATPAAAAAGSRYEDSTCVDLNPQQNAAFVRSLRWLNADAAYRLDCRHHAAPPLLHLLIDGAAGVGKSHFVRQLVARVGAALGVISCCAPTGIAACNLPAGRTVHSVVSLTLGGLLCRSAATIARARAMLEHTRILVIDEISMLDAGM
jgi:hypothetical protein